MKRGLITILTMGLLAAWPAAAHAYLPPGFIGISPQNGVNAKDMTLMRKAGIRSMRLPFAWAGVQPKPPGVQKADWGGYDHAVKLAAEAGIRVMPFLGGSPEWATEEAIDMPVRTARQRQGWLRFLREAARRYGPGGHFWARHTDISYLPIRRWEIWNEENLVTFAADPSPERYAILLRISGRLLHREDRGSQVLVGGFFGRPLQVPPNLASGDFLDRLYEAGRVKPFFDGVGLHPYVADARAMGGQLRNLRRIMRNHGDGRTPLYVTELGWGSHGGPTRWERGYYGQANQLSKAFNMLSENRIRWNIGGAWWFTWTDEGGGCLFCTSAGLLTAGRRAKPSWYRFNRWTGGNPDAVAKARSGE